MTGALERPGFDPNANFEVAGWPQGFTVNGREPRRGQAFDRHSVSVRTLRELHFKGWIRIVEKAPVFAPPARSTAPPSRDLIYGLPEPGPTPAAPEAPARALMPYRRKRRHHHA